MRRFWAVRQATCWICSHMAWTWRTSVRERRSSRTRGRSGWRDMGFLAGPTWVTVMPWDWRSATTWGQGSVVQVETMATCRPARACAAARPARAMGGPPFSGLMPEMAWRILRRAEGRGERVKGKGSWRLDLAGGGGYFGPSLNA